jgi:hypothetical protein
MLPELNRKRKLSEHAGMVGTANQGQICKAFEILNSPRYGTNMPYSSSQLTQNVRKFDMNRRTLFMKPKHQLSTSKMINDSSIDLNELSRTRPFSLEERNFSTNDISFTRILRSEVNQSSLNTTRINVKSKPPSFYNKDIKKWQEKFDNAIKNRTMVKKLM